MKGDTLIFIICVIIIIGYVIYMYEASNNEKFPFDDFNRESSLPKGAITPIKIVRSLTAEEIEKRKKIADDAKADNVRFYKENHLGIKLPGGQTPIGSDEKN